MHWSFLGCCGVLFAVSLFVSGCTLLKASPAADSGFLSSPERLQRNERFPFHAWWVKPGVVKGKGGKIHVAPVDTEYLAKVSDWSHLQVLEEQEIIHKAQELGNYFRERLGEEFRRREQGRFQLAQTQEESEGVLELAITELVPTDFARNAAGSVLGFFVPGGGIVSTGSAGSIAIEGRFRETRSGEVLAEFKDRETGRIAPVSFAGLTPFRHSQQAIEDWAEQIVEILESPDGAEVADSSPFTLLPW
jgi:hypothetical protein